MNTSLVGYTGFVGSNLAATKQFTSLYNSKNISEAFGTAPDLLVYAGVPAAKFLANSAPDRDRDICLQAAENIVKIQPKQLVLISTVDVYNTPYNVDENTLLACDNQAAYGKNRAELEQLASNAVSQTIIIRLPALFGGGLKKNFLYDMLTITPSMLKTEKYEELSANSSVVKTSYEKAQDGFYSVKQLDAADKLALRDYFEHNSFNALSFTDSRAEFQFYNLANLWHDIAWAHAANLRQVNFTSEPVSAAQIYEYITKGGVFTNELGNPVPKYNILTKYHALFNGDNGYIYSKEDILEDIAVFMRRAKI